MHVTPARIALALALGLFATRAQATFHLMKVVEVFAGTPASPNAKYVVIQMYASGQNLVNEHEVTVYNGAGQQVGSFGFTHNVANGANQAKILIATPEATSFFNVTPDLTMSAVLLAAGGKVCFAGTIDCVAWGAYTGDSAGVGPPFNPSGGITPSRAILRRLDIAGSASVLDAADDTGNSANDFRLGTPAPRNNAGMLGHAPSNTCGNGVIEGLEQCDDNDTSSGDGCSNVCTLEEGGGSAPRVAGDFNGDGRSDVFWRNRTTGANVIWRSADAAARQPLRAVDPAWNVVGRGDFDGNGTADVFWRDGTAGGNVLWLGANPATRRILRTVSDPDWRVAGVADFNGDGKADVFWRNARTGENAIWRSADPATAQAAKIVPDRNWLVVGAADYDGDGKGDIFWRNRSSGANALWRSGNGATPVAVPAVTNAAWIIAGSGDFNGDAKADLFWRNTSTGANSIWLSPNGASKRSARGVTGQDWQVANVGDVNGDGDADLVWRNGITGADVVWLSANGATKRSMGTVSDTAWRLVPYEAQPVAP